MDFPKLNACSIDLTEGCNLACDYCFTWSDHKTRNLPIPLGKTIIDFFIDNSIYKEDKEVNIDWWGGEPLMAWDTLKELQVWTINKYGNKIQFNGTTNSLLYTPEKIEWLMNHQSKGFMISCDGVRESHDAHRKTPNGKGSWKIVDKRMREAIKLNKDQGVRLSLHRERFT